jgi:hypothetical protein
VTDRLTLALTGLIAISFAVFQCNDTLAADGVDGAESKTPAGGKTGKYELKIKLPEVIRQKGNNELEITIHNVGSIPATFVMPGDGSECRWRTPLIGWSCIPVGSDQKHPKKPAEIKMARCGNINPLKANEVFSVQPGGATKLNEWAYFPYQLPPGKYRVVFYYTNQPEIAWQGLPLGNHDEKEMRRVKKSTPVSLVSNEVVVEVTQ